MGVPGEVRSGSISPNDLNGCFPISQAGGIASRNLAQRLLQFDTDTLPYRFLRRQTEDSSHSAADIVDHVLWA